MFGFFESEKRLEEEKQASEKRVEFFKQEREKERKQNFTILKDKLEKMISCGREEAHYNSYIPVDAKLNLQKHFEQKGYIFDVDDCSTFDHRAGEVNRMLKLYLMKKKDMI